MLPTQATVILVVLALTSTSISLPDWKAETWTALGTWATCLVLLATLIYVAGQLHEARELRREQIRPWITVGFHFRSNIAFVAVKNLGSTVARDVRISFEPELVSGLEQFQEATLYKEVTPAFVPGEERTTLLDRVSDRLQSDLPCT